MLNKRFSIYLQWQIYNRIGLKINWKYDITGNTKPLDVDSRTCDQKANQYKTQHKERQMTAANNSLIEKHVEQKETIREHCVQEIVSEHATSKRKKKIP